MMSDAGENLPNSRYLGHVTMNAMNGVGRHLEELQTLLSLAEGGAPSIFIAAKDSCVSIENTCKNALDDELAGAVSQLFNRTSGLPQLLLRSIPIQQNDANKKLLQDLRVEVLSLIDDLIFEVRAREMRLGILGEYVCEMVHACLQIFKCVNDSKVRVEAISTLIPAIQLREHVPNLSELLSMLFPTDADPVRNPNAPGIFWKHLATYSKSKVGSSETVRGGCLRALGAFAITYPVQVSDDDVYKERGKTGAVGNPLYCLVVKTLDPSAGIGQPELAGALDALDGILADETALRPDELRVAFQHAMRLLTLRKDGAVVGEDEKPKEELRRFGTPKAALQVLGSSLNLFAAQPGTALAEQAMADGGGEGRRLSRSLLLEHAEALWDALEELWDHKNAELRALADEVLRGVVRTVGQQVAEVERAATCESEADFFNAEYTQLRPNSKRAFYSLFRKISERVARASSEATGATSRGAEATARLGLAMNLLGSFARPVCSLEGASALEAQLVQLTEFAASHLQPEATRYYQAGKRSIDRSARQLPPFLAAHAALLEVVPKAPERTLDTCAALVLHLFATVDALPESSASVVRQGAIGVQQLLLALQTRGDALERFLQRWVYNAAIVTVDAAAQARMIASDCM